MTSLSGGVEGGKQKQRGVLSSTFWPIRAAGHESTVRARTEATKRRVASLRSDVASRPVNPNTYLSFSSSLVLHLETPFATYPETRQEQSGERETLQKPLEQSVVAGNRSCNRCWNRRREAWPLSWHTFGAVAWLNVFIFAFNSDVSPLPVMTNDYGNKLGRGRRVAEESYMYME